MNMVVHPCNTKPADVDKYRQEYPDIIAGFPSVDEARSTVFVFRLGRPTG